MTRDIWFDANNFLNLVRGSKTLCDKSNCQSKGELEVLYGSDSGNFTILEHHGDKSTNGDDIIFNRIYGENSFAHDHNENGVVDEGEITSYDTII